MKKSIKIALVAACALILLLGVYAISRIGGAELAEGVYKIQGEEANADANIIVRGNTIQFVNIDLNQIYQDAQLEVYERMRENGVQINMTEEQVILLSDLNTMFVSQPYEINYAEAKNDNKTGTFTYIYYCYGEDNLFGLVLEYDSLHKTIQINSPIKSLIFKR